VVDYAERNVLALARQRGALGRRQIGACKAFVMTCIRTKRAAKPGL
jgi:hypothetical protein